MSSGKQKYNMELPQSEIAELVSNVINKSLEEFDNLDILQQRNLIRMFVSSAIWDGETLNIELLNTNKEAFFLNEMFPQGRFRQ